MDFFSENFLMNSKNRLFLLFAIFAIALSLRAGRVMQIERVEKDGAQLLLIAENIRDNGLSEAFSENPRLPPLYILLLFVGIKLGFNSYLTGVFISVISGALLIFPVYFIARSVFSSILPSLISALLIAVYPNLARIGAEVLRDSLFQLLSISAIAGITAGIRSKKKYLFVLSGIFAALATATRSEGVEIFYALMIFLLFEIFISLLEKKQKLTTIFFENILIFAIFVASFFAVALPFERALKDTRSQWSVFDKRGVNFIKGFFEDHSQKKKR